MNFMQRLPIRYQQGRRTKQNIHGQNVVYPNQVSMCPNIRSFIEPPRENKLFQQKIQKIQRQLHQEQRRYKKRMSPIKYTNCFNQRQLICQSEYQRTPIFSYQGAMQMHISKTERIKTEQSNPHSTRIKTQQSADGYRQQDQGNYFSSSLSSLSNSKVKLSTNKKIIYQTVQRQIIYYPPQFKNDFQARQQSLIPLAKKGLVVKYDAQFRPMKSDLIYQFAKKDINKANPFVGYRQSTVSRPLNNFVQNPQLMKSMVQKEYKKRVVNSYSEAFLKRSESFLSKKEILNGNPSISNQKQQPLSPINLIKNSISKLKEVPQQVNFTEQQLENIQHNGILECQLATIQY